MTISTSDTSIALAIVAYPGVQMSAVLGLADLLSIASDYSVKNGGRGFSVDEITKADMTPPSQQYSAVILPPNLTGAKGKEETDIHKWLCDQHTAGSIMCSVCGGAFWLGYSGLLNRRPVTTHWLLDDEFQTTFPETQMHAEHLLIDDNDIVTTGGLMAWLDLGLFIINRFLGPEVMTQTARHLLIDTGGREQRNYRSFRPPLTHGDPDILNLQHWLEKNSANEITIKVMAEQTNFSERTFLRRFKAATGFTPNTYVQNLRIEKARGLLERTRIAITDIGWKVGYQDASAFSRVFKSTTGIGAGEYRKRFKVERI